MTLYTELWMRSIATHRKSMMEQACVCELLYLSVNSIVREQFLPHRYGYAH